MSRAERLIAERRLEILRFLVVYGGEANNRVIERAIRARGFYTVAAADIAGDLDHLDKKHCVTIMPLDALRLVTVTTLGEDVAHGRGKPIDGIDRSVWRR